MKTWLSGMSPGGFFSAGTACSAEKLGVSPIAIPKATAVAAQIDRRRRRRTSLQLWLFIDGLGIACLFIRRPWSLELSPTSPRAYRSVRLLTLSNQRTPGAVLLNRMVTVRLSNTTTGRSQESEADSRRKTSGFGEIDHEQA